jgi:hypothetical protein
MASFIETSLAAVAPVVVGSLITIMSKNAAVGLFKYLFYGTSDENEAEDKETNEDAEDEDAEDEDDEDAEEGSSAPPYSVAVVPEKGEEPSAPPYSVPIQAVAVHEEGDHPALEPSAPPYSVAVVPEKGEEPSAPPYSVPIQAVAVYEEGDHPALEPSSKFFNEEINIPGVNLNDFTKVKFDDSDQRSFIHAFYYLLNLGNKAPDKKTLDDFITKYLVKPLTKDMKPDNPLKVRFVMYQSGMYDDIKDTTGIFKQYNTVFDAMKTVATNTQKLDIFQMLDIISACDNLKLTFQNLDTLKSNIKQVFTKFQSFARMNENEQTTIYNREFPRLLQPGKDDFKLLLKVASTKPQELFSVLERCLEFVSHSLSVQAAYKELNTKYDNFIKSLITAPDEHAKFSRRNGVGDILAAVLSDNGVKCITFYNSHGTPHTYRCDNKDVYSGGVIMYKYFGGHCLLLIPKNYKSSSIAGVTTTAKPVNVDCNEYDKLFEANNSTMGGSTRKRCRRRSRRRVTKKRRRSHRTPLKKKSRKNPKKKYKNLKQ